MRALKKCPICGSPRISRVIKKLTLARGEIDLEIGGVGVDVCRNCGEQILDSAASRKIDAVAFGPHRTVRRRRSA